MSMEGRILGRWKLLREVGRGGMGQVWLAERREESLPDGFPDRAAIKMLPATLSLEPGIVLRFQREIEILSHLSHPGIVTFLEGIEYQENLGFAMEYVEGCSLQEVLQARGKLSWREAIAFAIQICQPLKHAHDRGVIHRDLKPSNILVKGWPDRPSVKLSDFGVASLFATRRLTATGGLVGTAETIAPEQVAGKPASKRTDLYSLGVVLYSLITGNFPFRGHLAEVLHKQRFGQYEKLSRLVDELPPELERLVDELLAKDPSIRPPDAGLVARRLQVIARREFCEIDGPPLVNPGDWSNSSSEHTLLPMGDIPRPGEGAATFVSRAVREHLQEQNRGNTWSRLMRSPWVVMPLFLGVAGALIWTIWPQDDEALLLSGLRLMESPEPDDWRKGWVEYLKPLAESDGRVSPPDGFSPYKDKYTQATNAAMARRSAVGFTLRSDAQWYFVCAQQLFRKGQKAEAFQIFTDIVLAFGANPAEAPWVDKSQVELEKFSEIPTPNKSNPREALLRLEVFEIPRKP